MPSEFGWTETPSIDAIPPALSLSGELEGVPFTPGGVTVEQDEEGAPRVIILHAEPADAASTAAQPACRGVRITLPSAIADGDAFVKTLDDKRDDCSATYCLPPEADGEESDGSTEPAADAPAPTEVAADWACAIRIDDCGGPSFDPEGDETQLTGALTGAIAVCFSRVDEDTGEEVRSWVAGRFSDGRIQCTRPLPETEEPSAESASPEST